MHKNQAKSTTQYERRRPERTALYRVVQKHLETFFDHLDSQEGPGLPRFVRKEFEAFLDCGILPNGFVRIRCDDCRSEKLVAFSCKRRGFCPSCAGKRMAQTSAHWLDSVIPHVPVRQWVLSLPIPLRFLLAAMPHLISPILGIVHRALSMFLCREFGLSRAQGQTGAISVIQRFGSAANLNLHVHCLVLDGVYRLHDEGLQFVPLERMPVDKLPSLLEKIVRRIVRHLIRQGLLIEEHGEMVFADSPNADALAQLQWASCTYRIAFGPQAGKKLFSTPRPRAANDNPSLYCVNAYGFSLHAGTRCDAPQRRELEKLCRYLTRPPIANERVCIDPVDGKVILELKTPYRDGTREIRFTPLEFMARLAALVPRPWINLVRYHGIFAPNAKWRGAIVPTPSIASVGEEAPSAGADSSWAMLLKRVFKIDVLSCSNCGGPMRLVAAITDPSVIRRILGHLGLPTRPPPPSPSRMPFEN